MDKKGLSTIVITLIIILVSLVAIGIIWVVVRNLVGSGSGQIEINAKCIGTDVQATAIVCAGTPKICNITFARSGTETSTIGGLKLVFKNVTGGTTYETSTVVDRAYNVDRLLGKYDPLVPTGIDTVNRVEVSVYFADSQGNAQICSQTNTLVF